MTKRLYRLRNLEVRLACSASSYLADVFPFELSRLCPSGGGFAYTFAPRVAKPLQITLATFISPSQSVSECYKCVNNRLKPPSQLVVHSSCNAQETRMISDRDVGRPYWQDLTAAGKHSLCVEFRKSLGRVDLSQDPTRDSSQSTSSVSLGC